jgi:hypothetical protein
MIKSYICNAFFLRSSRYKVTPNAESTNQEKQTISVPRQSNIMNTTVSFILNFWPMKLKSLSREDKRNE